MAATWRLIFLISFFSEFPRNLVYTYIGFRGLRGYSYCPLSCETENEAASAILILSILINRSFFQLIALKPGIYSHCISPGVFECLHGIFHQSSALFVNIATGGSLNFLAAASMQDV